MVRERCRLRFKKLEGYQQETVWEVFYGRADSAPAPGEAIPILKSQQPSEISRDLGGDQERFANMILIVGKVIWPVLIGIFLNHRLSLDFPITSHRGDTFNLICSDY